MRVVLDTNTIVSGLLWTGAPRQIVALIEQEKIALCTSPTLIAELRDVVGRPKFSNQLRKVHQNVDDVIERYIEHADTIVEPHQVPTKIAADPDDDHVLACAVAADADYIISGDRHLLDLGNYEGIPILNAADFLAVYQAASQSSN